MYDLIFILNNFDPALENCLFVPVNLTKNSDIDKYGYAGYGIGFDSKGTFSHRDGIHANNGANNILILGKDFIQGINGTKIYA